MTRALILGVTGQDGSLLADMLLEKGYEVYGVARRTSTPNTRNLTQALSNRRFHLVSGDITDYSSMSEVFHSVRPQEVYNLAAQSHVGESFKQPLATWDITGKGSLIVLEAIKQSNCYPKYVFAASSEMFGNNRRADGFIDETTPFNPQSPYAIAKVAGYYTTQLYRTYGLFCCNCIAFNHESHRRGETFVTRKITKYFAENYDNIINGRMCSKLKLGNLYACRDWSYAGDIIRGMWKMLQQEKPDDYILASGETHSVEDFLNETLSCLDLPRWVKDKYLEISSDLKRPAEVHHLLGDATKAKEKLEWKRTFNFHGLVDHMLKSDRGLNGKTESEEVLSQTT